MSQRVFGPSMFAVQLELNVSPVDPFWILKHVKFRACVL